MHNARHEILKRIRESLSVPTVRRDEPLAADTARAMMADCLPPRAEGFEAQAAQFREWSERLRTEFHVVSDLDAMRSLVREIVKEGESPARVAVHVGALIDRVCEGMDVAMRAGGAGWNPGGAGWKDDLAACEIGITECEGLIANMGSVLMTARSSGGRVLSVLPPHHIVLARREQMVPDITAGYALMREKYGSDHLPAFISLITGPSRTGDIERTLVLGAHGPKRLTVICATAL